MFPLFKRLSFITGICIGVLLATLVKYKENSIGIENPAVRPLSLLNYKKWFSERHLTRRRVLFDSIRYSNATYNLESNYLFKEVNVFCVILIKSQKNVKAAQHTWARHCNDVFLINLNTQEKRIIPVKKTKQDSSWVLLCKFLQQVPEKFKWILVVYDYTFVLLENLRLLLAALNPDEKYYLGHAVRLWSTDYNAGQAGYVLSRGSLNLFKHKMNSSNSCSKGLTYMNQEDYYLGKVMSSLNIFPSDTRDDSGLSTFHPYNLYKVFQSSKNDMKSSVYPYICCSNISITFQSIEGDKMYTYYYLLYTVQLFHYGHLGNKPARKLSPDEEIWKNFLNVRDIPLNITAEQYYKIWENIVDDPSSFARHMKREEYFDYS